MSNKFLREDCRQTASEIMNNDFEILQQTIVTMGGTALSKAHLDSIDKFHSELEKDLTAKRAWIKAHTEEMKRLRAEYNIEGY